MKTKTNKKLTKKIKYQTVAPVPAPPVRQTTINPTYFELANLAATIDSNASIDPKGAIEKAWALLQAGLDYTEAKYRETLPPAPF